jgi:hypothetical protein
MINLKDKKKFCHICCLGGSSVICDLKRETIDNTTVLPSANSVLDNIGFVYPFYVYDRDRPLVPILYDVYWLAMMMMLHSYKIEIPGIQSRIRIEYFSREQWTMKVVSNKIINWKQKSNKRWIKTNNKSNNTNTTITAKRALFTT